VSSKAYEYMNNKRVVVTLPGEFKRAKNGYKCYPQINFVITPQSDKRNLQLFDKSFKE
jgi:hypothetical protein